MVSAPVSRATSATIGAPPVPVPPPRQAVTKTISAPRSASARASRDSSAARRPLSGSLPAPSPLVSRSPMRTLTSAGHPSSAWRSVFTATYCTPGSRAEIMRVTALEPPPPTPTTLIGGRVSKS